MNRTYTYVELKDLINEELVNYNFIIESKHDHNVDQSKNNNFPLMVSDKGDIYYVHTTQGENLNILHKMSNTISISSYDMSRAYIGKDKIVVTSKYSIPKEQVYRNHCARKGWFVTNISYLQGGI